MRDGPIPLLAHGFIEYVGGALFIALPFLLGYDSGAATALSIVIGVAMIAIAASTDGPTSLVNQVPRAAHVALDYVLVVVLIALPFLAGFSGETAPDGGVHRGGRGPPADHDRDPVPVGAGLTHSTNVQYSLRGVVPMRHACNGLHAGSPSP